MKLPNLPIEFIRRVLTDKEMRSLKEKLSLPSEMYGAILVMASSYSISSYTIEELGKLGVLKDVITANIHLCDRYDLTKEALELFDEIKSNSRALNYFIEGIPKLGQNLLKDRNLTKHILDTLVGPEWQDPDFYLYDDDSLKLIDENSRRKKNISSILCDGLCIFDNIPEDRINKFYDALRRLIPYFKRRGFCYAIGNESRISYKEEDFPISIPERIKQQTTIGLYWCIEDNQLIIEKIFRIGDHYAYMPRNELLDVLNRLKEKYPNVLEEEEDSKISGIYVEWHNKQEYNIPADLEELTDI